MEVYASLERACQLLTAFILFGSVFPLLDEFLDHPSATLLSDCKKRMLSFDRAVIRHVLREDNS